MPGRGGMESVLGLRWALRLGWEHHAGRRQASIARSVGAGGLYLGEQGRAGRKIGSISRFNNAQKLHLVKRSNAAEKKTHEVKNFVPL